MSKQKLEEYRDLIVNNRFALHNHVTLTDLEENSAEGYLDVEDDVTNAYGMVHGGAFYALADVIAGMTARGNGHAYVTQTADLHYLSSTEEKRIYGKSRVLRRSRQTAVIEAEVTDGVGKCLFFATFTFFCVDGRVAVKREGKSVPTHNRRKKINIVGHKNPDTDSICAALSYCWLKKQIDPQGEYEARRAGSVNRESQFVLNYWNMKAPRLITSVSPQMKDIDFRIRPGIDGEMSLREVWKLMREEDIETLCITTEEQELLGLVSVTDITNINMNLLDNGILATAKTPYKNLISTLDAEMISGDPEACIEQGHIYIGTSPEVIEEFVNENDIVLVSNRYEAQICAIECGASCIVICCGAVAGKTILNRAKEKNCTVLASPYDTYAAARLISTAIPVRHIMQSEKLLQFGLNTYVEDAKKIMASVRHRYFPILDSEGKYVGVVSRRNLLNLHPKRVILVDHNEFTQTVDGMEQAEILEIIDHHRIGNLETGGPAYFRNEPVGCTNTIVYSIMQEKNLTPPKEIAGLMLSAILSDTLMFRSPTCTARDRAAAEALAAIAEVDIESYANQMFEAGEDLSGRSAEDIFFADFKVFTFGDIRFGVSQSTFMTEKNRKAAEELVKPFLEAAANRTGVDTVYYMATDTPSESTELFWYGNMAEEYARRAFGRAPETEGYFYLPGVVSRKKQMIPPLRMAMQAEP